MSYENTAFTGRGNVFRLFFEVRKIYVAQGVDFREEDVGARRDKGNDEEPLLEFLQRNFKDQIEISDSIAEYTSFPQMVHFVIQLIRSKDEFQKALADEGAHVIYIGHSRYGRGACFDPDSPAADYQHGDQWETGTSEKNGLFRLGYPYVPVSLDDFEHHQYHFAPLSVESSIPAVEDRHPEARVNLTGITLPEDLRKYVKSGYESTSNKYWGFRIPTETSILLYAGWQNTANAPLDLGATEIKCKCFCHFGCSSRLHYWKIIRSENYKNWQRDTPPTNKFAYFTTAPADYASAAFWLFYLLNYRKYNSYHSWWNSLEFAKTYTNLQLKGHRYYYQIY